MTTIPDRTEVGTVTLTVRDLDRVGAFYEAALGLHVEQDPQDSNRLLLSVAGEPPLLELRGNPSATPPDPRWPGLFHIALLVPSRRDLAIALMRVAAHGVRLTGASDHLVSEALYLRDPEQNGIEIYRDRPRADWPRDEHGRPRLDSLPLDLRALAEELVGDPPPPQAAVRMPSGTRIGHIHLQVAELGSSERFYAGVIGLGVTSRDLGGALFLAAGGYHHHVGLNTWHSAGSQPVPDGAAGLHAFELRLPTLADLADVVERVVGDEIAVEPLEHGALVRDPSGNAVILTA